MPAIAAKPRAMFGPLCGGPDDIPGTPASRPSRPGWPRWRRRRCSLPAAESPPTRTKPTGTFHVKVTEASFPRPQHLGQTSLLQLGIRNTGKRTVPGLTVTFTIAGKEGVDSSLPFGVSDPQTGTRPARPAGLGPGRRPTRACTAPPTPAAPRPRTRRPSPSGPLKPGETTQAVWKLSAVRAGKYTLLYNVGAGLSGEAKAKTENGVAPGGSFTTEITAATAGNRSHRQRRNR